MADTKSLCLIGYRLTAVTALVSIMAMTLVMNETRITAERPTVHAAIQPEVGF
jgi:hypothetical protein